MSLSRLQELSALHQVAQPQINEDKKPNSKFYAIQDFVSDSIADLEDALGSNDKSGSLYELEPRPAVAKLKPLLVAFKKSVEKVMTDIEVEMMADAATKLDKMSEAQSTEADKNALEDELNSAQ